MEVLSQKQAFDETEKSIVGGLRACEIQDRIEAKEKVYSMVAEFYSQIAASDASGAESIIARLERGYYMTKGHWKDSARKCLSNIISDCKTDMEDWRKHGA